MNRAKDTVELPASDEGQQAARSLPRVRGLHVWMCLMLLAAVIMVTGLLRWQQVEQELERVAAEQDAAITYARQIIDSRDAPNRIGEEEMRVDLLAQLIESAADQATIPRRSLDRIWPQPAQRLGDSDYQRKPTQLLVRDATLPQAISFLHGLATGPSPLSIDSIRLSTPASGKGGRANPSQGNAPETWNLETTVSHLLYKPITPASKTPVASAATRSVPDQK